MIIKGLKFERTCDACPEQYSVFNDKGKQIGYIRYRWGVLTCQCPYTGGDIIFQKTLGDNYDGLMENWQREKYLGLLAEKIQEWAIQNLY